MNNIYFNILNNAAQAQKRVQPPKAASAPQPKPAAQTAKAPAAKSSAAKTNAAQKAPPKNQNGTERRTAQMQELQQKLTAQKAEAKANSAVVINKNDLTEARIREIFVWTEILGEPKCRRRHRSRSRRIER